MSINVSHSMSVAGHGTKPTFLIFLPKAYLRKLKKLLCVKKKNLLFFFFKSYGQFVQYHNCLVLRGLTSVSEKCL